MGWDSWLYGVLSFKPSGLIALAVLGYFIWLVRRPAAAGYGAELRLWTPIYAFYVLAATRVTPSVVRYLMLVAIPWWPLPACADWSLRERRAKIAILLQDGESASDISSAKAAPAVEPVKTEAPAAAAAISPM